MSRRGPLKRLTRVLRLKLYHSLHGAGFRYHGIPITVPDEIPFGIKKQLMRGRYEEPERRLVERFLDPAVATIELGGSLGVLSAFIGSRLKPETPYLIVEANPRVLDTCRTNARTGRGTGQVEVLHGALAYGGDTVEFPIDDNVHVNRVGSTKGGTVSVPASTLAGFVEQLAGHGQPYALVMDIEGAEFDVFLNEPEAFAACSLAIVETHPHLFAERGKTVADFLELVRKAGMRVLAQDGISYAFGRV